MRISGGERALAVLSYLPILWLIPLKAKKDSLFVQFHARQGMVLFLLWLVIVVLVMILALVFSDAESWVSTIIFGVAALATFVYLVMGIIGIFKVALGERYRMPVVADVALMLKL